MLTPHSYQTDAASTAINANTIINIKTGGGKTLIAVLVAKYFLEKYPTKLIMFLVPSRALVGQQAEYLRQHINISRTVLVTEMCGQEIDTWTAAKWQSACRNYNIFVGTAEVFRKAFVDQGYLSPSSFSLLIFDECHNAVGNAPMASLLRDAIHPIPSSQRPRILGLTASFVNGSLKNIIDKRRKLEEVMQANIISPEVNDATVTTKAFHYVNVSPEDLTLCTEALAVFTKSVLSLLPRQLFDEKELRRQVDRGNVVFQGLGLDGYVFWLREGIVLQLIAEAEELQKRPELPCQNRAHRMKSSLQEIRRILQSSAISPSIEKLNPPALTQKSLRLLELLVKLYNQDIDFRGIVFVEQIAMTYPLAHVVNTYFAQYYVSADAEAVWPMLPISGANSMLDRVRNENLAKFRSGAVPLLVSTPSLEEGIDVPECSFIIRYDHVMTTKAHIQGSGRARRLNADIYYFQNEPTAECAKAAYLETVARSKDLNITEDDMKQHIHNTTKSLANEDFEYPFNPSSPTDIANQVNFFNCLTILYEYVQGVMKQSFNPEECIYTIKEEIVSRIPLEFRKKIQSVAYPTPAGIRIINRDAVDNFWRGHEVTDVVVPAERMRNMKSFDIEKRRFVYYVVIVLHRERLLLCNNKPSAAAKSETKHSCPAYMMKDRIHIKDTMDPKVLRLPN